MIGRTLKEKRLRIAQTFLGITASLLVLVVALWIIAVWTGDGRIGATGGLLLVLCIVTGIVSIAYFVAWEDTPNG